MSNSENLTLPFIEAAQAQKHVTHNEALLGLDAIVQLSVLDRDLTAPPGGPADGDRYLVAASATGDWAGEDGNIAAWQDGVWRFYVPKTGWICWIVDEGIVQAFDGSSWVNVIGNALQNLTMLGVNTTADATNRLAVSSAAVLFNHDGSGMQAKLNKNAAGDTASLLMQTNGSGRAEMGLAGDDDFHVKVSPDGGAWLEALRIDRNKGYVIADQGLSVANLNGGPLAGFRNKIVNGGFDVWQRGTSFAAAAGYTADRWKISSGGAAATVTRESNTRPGSPSKYMYKIAGASGVTAVFPGEHLCESYVATQLGAGEFTYSIWIYNGTGADFTPTLNLDTFDVEDVSGVLTNRASPALQLCPNGAWTRVRATIDGSAITSIENGFRVYLSGAIVLNSTGKYLVLSDAQCEPGNAVTPFEHRPYAQELALSQRYYCTARGHIRFRAALAAEAAENAVYWPSQMRISAPTASIKTAGVYANANTIGVYSPDESGCRFYVDSAAAGDVYALSYLIEADAEL